MMKRMKRLIVAARRLLFNSPACDGNADIRLNPTTTDGYIKRGIAWFMKGQMDKAIADYNEALGLNPQLRACGKPLPG